MRKTSTVKSLLCILLSLASIIMGLSYAQVPVYATSFPPITVDFDPTDQSVIVAGIPAYDSTGTIQYELNGYMYYGDERIETFCYAPSVYAHHVPDEQAYIFNWTDAEFLLPCSGDYEFTAYVTAITKAADGSLSRENGPKTTIGITLTKKDESTNWGPGLPNTTVETYDLNQIKDKDKTIRIEEEGYTWTIEGKNISSVPEENLSLAVIHNPDTFPMQGVDAFFGNTIAAKFSIEHNGEFGFLATLEYFLGTEYIGKYANLFYVMGNGSFEFIEGSPIDDAGMASFAFTHASDYIIAVTDIAYTGQELNPKPDIEPETSVDTEIVESTEPGTFSNDIAVDTDVTATLTPDTSVPESNNTSNSPVLAVVLIAVLIIAVVIIFVMKKNRK